MHEHERRVVEDIVIDTDQRLTGGYLVNVLARAPRRLYVVVGRTRTRHGESEAFTAYYPEDKDMLLAVNAALLQRRGRWKPRYVTRLVGRRPRPAASARGTTSTCCATCSASVPGPGRRRGPQALRPPPPRVRDLLQRRVSFQASPDRARRR